MISRQKFDVIIPLKSDFRFAHEPLADALAWEGGADDFRFVARDEELAELSMRLLLSQGGAFLVTGYRGVGKTSFVNQVIQQIKTHAPELSHALGQPVQIVDVRMNLARVMQPMEIMHHILRGLYCRLEELGLLDRLGTGLRKELRLAFLRTSFHITRTASQAYEGEVEFGGLKWLGLNPTLRANAKRSREEELEYLGYDDKVAEYDVMRISRLLSRGYPTPLPFWKRLIRTIRRRSQLRTPLKLIFIFDELDKLEAARTANAISPVDEMISMLKNVFTTSGICFIFIAGKDLQDRWRADIGRGDSVYESVFSYNRYLPAMWQGVGNICDRLVEGAAEAIANRPSTQLMDKSTLPQNRPAPSKTPPGWQGKPGLEPVNVYTDFQRFLAFIGRGIPRRIVRQFNEFVYWDGQPPFLGFTREKYRRIKFFADLQLMLEQRMEELLGDVDDDSLNPYQDHFKLGIYYLIDWILTRRSTPFTLDDAAAASRSLSEKIALADDVASDVIQRLAALLKKNNYLEEVAADPGQARVKPGEALQPRYRLRRERVVQMGKATGVFKEESLLFTTPSPGTPKRLGQYEIKDEIGRGGMAEVYRAWDTISQREVAIKILSPAWSNDKNLVERFIREGKLMVNLQEPGHPNIVRFYQQGRAEDGRYFIVMSYIAGQTLADLLKAGLLSLHQSLFIIRAAGSAYSYAHAKGMYRLDIKPGNIIIDRSGQVIVIDFGIAHWKTATSVTVAGHIIGTPEYMAPEQIKGEKPDARSDIYSLGVVFYQMLAGRPPFTLKDTAFSAFYETITQPASSLSNFITVPRDVEAAVMKCLAKNPSDRFQSIDEFLTALPESKIATPLLAAFVEKAEAKLAARAAIEEIETKSQTITLAGNFQVPPLPMSTQEVHAASLVGISGAMKDQIFRVGNSMTIGRSSSADLVLEDSQVSRYHTRINHKPDVSDSGTVVASGATQIWKMQKGIYVIEDLGSGVGTFVNGQTVRHPLPLADQDQIKIGNHVFVFRLPNR